MDDSIITQVIRSWEGDTSHQYASQNRLRLEWPTLANSLDVFTDRYKREAIVRAHPNSSWDKKVDEMTSTQINEIYIRFKASGKL